MNFIQNMGPFGWLLILLTPMILIAALTLRLAAPRLRMYGAPLFTGVLMLGLGTTGSFAGLIQAFKAVAAASAEQKDALLARGTEIALSTTWVALVAVLLIGIVWGLARVVPIHNPKPPPRDKAGWAMTILSVLLLVLWLATPVLLAMVAYTFLGMADITAATSGPDDMWRLALRISRMMYVGEGISLLTMLVGLLLIPVTGIIAILRLRKAGPAEEA
jgi:hypothetical protein